jgi:hypothetical protein
MSLASFVSVLFKARVRIVYVSLSLSPVPFQHFLKKRNRMSEKTVQRNRKISSKLVHIEQVIGLAKHIKLSPLL